MKTIAITGVLGYSGRYIAEEAVRRAWHVIGITDSAGRLPNPHGYELRPMPWSPGGEHALDGVDVLVNTYWVRFSYNGRNHAAFSHTEAVEHTLHLFSAAKAAGVQRIVHTSITHPDAASPLPYFRGKAQLEQALEESATPHSILRPAILFGDTPAESILINNMAWSLRHLPCVATFGFGENYRLQPIHVRDYAELAMDEAENSEAHRIVNAVGAETYTFRDLWKMLADGIGAHRPILPVPDWMGLITTRLLGAALGDVMLTQDEIKGLREDRLAVDGATPIGSRVLSAWTKEHASTLGRCYASELQRRR